MSIGIWATPDRRFYLLEGPADLLELPSLDELEGLAIWVWDAPQQRIRLARSIDSLVGKVSDAAGESPLFEEHLYWYLKSSVLDVLSELVAFSFQAHGNVDHWCVCAARLRSREIFPIQGGNLDLAPYLRFFEGANALSMIWKRGVELSSSSSVDVFDFGTQSITATDILRNQIGSQMEGEESCHQLELIFQGDEDAQEDCEDWLRKVGDLLELNDNDLAAKLRRETE